MTTETNITEPSSQAAGSDTSASPPTQGTQTPETTPTSSTEARTESRSTKRTPAQPKTPSTPKTDPASSTAETLFSEGPSEDPNMQTQIEVDSDKPEFKEREGGYYNGKYKTVEELEKGLKNAETKLREGVPESYDLKSALEEAGLSALDTTEHAGVYEEYTTLLREAGFKPDQVKAGAKILQMQLKNHIQKNGVDVDLDREREVLKRAWGAETADRAAYVMQRAKQDIPPALAKAIFQHADGYMWLEAYYDSGRGAMPILDKVTGRTVNRVDIERDVDEIMAKPAYRNPNDPSYNELQDQVRKLLSKTTK